MTVARVNYSLSLKVLSCCHLKVQTKRLSENELFKGLHKRSGNKDTF